MARRQMAGSVSVVTTPGDSLFIDAGDFGGTPPGDDPAATHIRVGGASGAAGEYVGRWYEGGGAGQIAYLMDRATWNGGPVKTSVIIELNNGGGWFPAICSPTDSDAGLVFVNRADYGL